MRTPLERIRLGGFVLAAVFILAILGYHFVGDYDWIAVVWMVVITSFTVGYGETSQLPPRIQALAALVTLLGGAQFRSIRFSGPAGGIAAGRQPPLAAV